MASVPDVAAAAAPEQRRLLNVNVGVLGHVDSGKTALVAALSTLLSTAALDKHPQSKERGITLDLGFSSFSLGSMPPHLAHLPYDELQFTLVDCPGHASLIRTIIGGMHIMDTMLLVIDITKGLQAQTAECLVVAEVATPSMIVVLNKIDQLPEQDRAKTIRKAAKRLAQTLQMTKFAAAPMIPVAAKPGGGGPPEGIDALKSLLVASVPPTLRTVSAAPFLMAIDHCFMVKGQGTVMTGTLLRGSVSVGQVVELPELKLQRPVRSIQAFRRPVTSAQQGDRVGVCVAQLDPTLIERGIAAAPGTLPTFSVAIAAVEKVRFYASHVTTGERVHINVGHSTVMAEVTAIGTPDGTGVPAEMAVSSLVESMARLSVDAAPEPFAMGSEYLAQLWKSR
ncbi:hypothetical protein FOA52_010359 [Chlamydomonas sp. UWO 241]|nr:hypothetical protein FOA52_010359 [Chlamydomonas sp. UWO 241]